MGWGGGKGVYVFLSAILLSKFNFKLNNPGVCVGGRGGGVGYPTASSQPVHLNKPKLDFVPSPSHPKLRKHCILVFKKNHRTVLRILAKLPIYRCAYNE